MQDEVLSLARLGMRQEKAEVIAIHLNDYPKEGKGVARPAGRVEFDGPWQDKVIREPNARLFPGHPSRSLSNLMGRCPGAVQRKAM